MRKYSAFGAALACALLLGSGPAKAGENALTMTIGAMAPQPIGHHLYCRDAETDCAPRTAAAAPEPVALEPLLIARIASLNMEVNRLVKPASDKELYGVEERWAMPGGRGDCEDYALLKRQRLAEEAGIDVGNLLLTVVRKRDGRGHAVLTLRTTQGDFILDNLDWRVRLWSETPYTFVKRQNPLHAGRWQRIEAADAVLMTAVEK